jgi:hypothetical protein
MDPVPAQHAAYWRQRAEKVRMLATEQSNELAKQGLLALAKTYERLALGAITRSKAKPHGRQRKRH